MLFLFCVALWIVLRGASYFKVFPCSLSSCFVVPFGIVITSLGDGGAGLCASLAFVCFVLNVLGFVVCACWFSVRDWLLFFIRALPGLFY